ncbi:MAG TPA: SIMPL domain-containing protein [Candidatus Angelobacter sp.]
MKRLLSWCAALALVPAGMSLAQTAPTITAQANTVYVGADGKYEAAPDTAVLHVDIATQQETARAAYDRVAAAAEQVRKVMRDSGLDPKAAQIGFYAVQPIYDWKNPKRKILGYRVVTSVTLKLHDLAKMEAKIGALTEQLANIEDAQNQTLSYTLEDVEQAKAKATEDALKKARNQAAVVATTGGRSLGDLLFASVDVSQPVIIPMMAQPVMARAMGAEAAPATSQFTPQTVTITAHVNAMFGLK